MKESCIFCRIAAGSIPAKIAHEDDDTFAFHDIDPRAPVHVLIVPREHINTVNELEPSDAGLLGRMVLAAKKIANELGVADSGYRLVMNCGQDAGQSVDHIHLHLLGGRPLKWPPG
ncbi:MAG: histidine triad nucleotide-binding protein [Gemmatimonadota bacterium]